MKKIYSFLFFVLLCSNAFAGSDSNYYWFYDRVEAAPTGKGVIYAAESNDPEPTESDYQESVEVKFHDQGTDYGLIYAWAKATDGYQFAGWFSSATDSTTLEEQISTSAEQAILSVTTTVSSESDETDLYLIPDDTIFGIFSKVTIQAPDGLPLEHVATLGISKVANDTDDEITLTATLANETVRFDYWLDSKGNKVEANPYTFTVSDMETYTAHFSGDSIKIIDFGEGKYIPYSSTCSAQFSGGIYAYRVIPVEKVFYDENGNPIEFDESENDWGYWNSEYDENGDLISEEFVKYTGEIPEFDSSYELSKGYYNYTAGEGVVLYGKGQQFIVLYNDEYSFPSDNYLVGTADGDVNIAELPTTDEDGNAITYYTFDGTDFVKATSGVVPQGECYLALDETQYPLPDKIPFAEKAAEEEEAGIDAPTVDAPAALAAPAVKGIYTIDGKQIARPIKGAINIIDGKKVFVK